MQFIGERQDQSLCLVCKSGKATFVSKNCMFMDENPYMAIWALFCDRCADQQRLRYYYPGGGCEQNYGFDMYSLSAATEAQKFPVVHAGEQECTHCHAGSDKLAVCYNELSDEFLVCTKCLCFKQQLRVWNKNHDRFIESLEPPVVLSPQMLRRMEADAAIIQQNRAAFIAQVMREDDGDFDLNDF